VLFSDVTSGPLAVSVSVSPSLWVYESLSCSLRLSVPASAPLRDVLELSVSDSVSVSELDSLPLSVVVVVVLVNVFTIREIVKALNASA
jgi:hypothetical protein